MNDGIKADSYLNMYPKLRFPTIDNLTRIVMVKGVGCLLFKPDLRAAYHQLFCDFGDIALLGYWFEDAFYFDLVMPMGLVSTARCCQMVTDAITYIFFS